MRNQKKSIYIMFFINGPKNQQVKSPGESMSVNGYKLDVTEVSKLFVGL